MKVTYLIILLIAFLSTFSQVQQAGNLFVQNNINVPIPIKAFGLCNVNRRME